MSGTWTALAVTISYLVGAIPFAYLLGRWKGVDIRAQGSGNVGATNLGRILGRPYGIASFALDALKGAIPVLGAGFLGESLGWDPAGRRGLMSLCGAGAIAGHIWPVYLGFRGGKGVATSIGVAGVLTWQATFIALVVWLIGTYLLRYVFVGSVLFALALPVSFLALEGRRAWSEEMGVTLLLIGICLIVAIRHRSNFRRFMAGEEGKTAAPDPEVTSDAE
ncbi:MAG: glycerol-3-phosphate 1-O-acyltransferase PlsY [Planctomycetota bacterium]|nr:glycerol-3-phosphate 1-O-acyltransferase PlsY [Planctomycetota bacterium]